MGGDSGTSHGHSGHRSSSTSMSSSHISYRNNRSLNLFRVTLVLTPDKLQCFLDLHTYEITISPPPSSAHCKQKNFLQVFLAQKSKPLSLCGEAINLNPSQNFFFFFQIITSLVCVSHLEFFFPCNYNIKINRVKSVTRQSNLISASEKV